MEDFPQLSEFLPIIFNLITSASQEAKHDMVTKWSVATIPSHLVFLSRWFARLSVYLPPCPKWMLTSMSFRPRIQLPSSPYPISPCEVSSIGLWNRGRALTVLLILASDEELYEDNPIEYIRRDLEGSGNIAWLLTQAGIHGCSYNRSWYKAPCCGWLYPRLTGKVRGSSHWYHLAVHQLVFGGKWEEISETEPWPLLF